MRLSFSATMSTMWLKQNHNRIPEQNKKNRNRNNNGNFRWSMQLWRIFFITHWHRHSERRKRRKSYTQYFYAISPNNSNRTESISQWLICLIEQENDECANLHSKKHKEYLSRHCACRLFCLVRSVFIIHWLIFLSFISFHFCLFASVCFIFWYHKNFAAICRFHLQCMFILFGAGALYGKRERRIQFDCDADVVVVVVATCFVFFIESIFYRHTIH